MPLPSSQESTGSCIPEPLPLGVAWGSQPDEAFSQGASQQGSEMATTTTMASVTPASQGRQVRYISLSYDRSVSRDVKSFFLSFLKS